jgi:hypothetical protein
MKLKRVAYGPLRLAKMPPGAYRPLTIGEVRQLENYDPRHDKRYARRAKPETAVTQEDDPATVSGGLATPAEAAPRKRARREAADLHGHLEGAPPGRVLRRPKPAKGARPQGTVLGGERKIKLKPGSQKFVRPWEKPSEDDLDEV